MELTQFRIEGFRCIRTAGIKLRNVTSLIGPNNAGKSSLLKAMDLFFSSKKPEFADWPTGKSDAEIVFEATFSSIDANERKIPGIAGLVFKDQIRLRAAYRFVEGRVEGGYECWKQEEQIDGWSEKFGDLSAPIKAIAKDLGIDGNKFKTASAKETIKQKVRETKAATIVLAGENWVDDGLSIDQAIQQGLPKPCFIPAVRDATDEAKAKSGTAFDQIMLSAILPAIEGTEEFKKLLESAAKLALRLKGETPVDKIEAVKKDISARLSQLIPATITLNMSSPDSRKFIGANIAMGLDDGGTTDVSRQGNGLQRAMIFAMLEHIAEATPTKSDHRRPNLLLFEEPELYVHPQLLRRYRDVLRTIGARAGWQVVLATHSPIMVDVGHDPLSLVIVRRANPHEPPTFNQPDDDPFGADEEARDRIRATLDFHPTAAEAFFAPAVVLVEGESEVAILDREFNWPGVPSFGLDHNADVTVVNCGGKWTIPAFAAVLTAFKVPYRIIHDLDKKKRSDDDLAKAPGNDPYRANERIRNRVEKAITLGIAAEAHLVDDTLEDVLWNDGKSHTRDKPYQAWKRAKEIHEKPDQASPGFKALLEFVFGKNTAPGVAAPAIVPTPSKKAA